MYPVLSANTPPSTGYNLTKSLRFRRSASAYLSRTPASASNQKTWTFSAWVKRGSLGLVQGMYDVSNTGSQTTTSVYFTASDTIRLQLYTDPTYNTYWESAGVFRDPSAWYHIVAVLDTTQASQTNMAKLYINGVQQTFSYTNVINPIPQNSNWYVNSTQTHKIGSYYGGNYLDGYMTEINFVDGQALTPSSFGSTNATTGVWQPAKYTGTYGTNGFYLPFTNTTSTTTLGYDFSGNSNNWTTNNISLTAGSTYDSMTDVPTLTSASVANYCVANPITPGTSTSNGNLSLNTGNVSTFGTIQIPSTGKWYWEFTPNDANGLQSYCGVANYSNTLQVAYYGYDGNKYINGTGSAYGSAYGNGDVIGVFIDADNNLVRFYKNNTAQNTITYTTAGNSMFPYFSDGTGSYGININVNFGQQPFTYTPPTGAIALNTYNLPDSTIVKGNTAMDATTYTGNGTTLSVTNSASFKPDLVWNKVRSTTNSNILEDSVRGATKGLYSDSTSAEVTNADFLQSFNSNGFTVGPNALVNQNTQTYVAWQWQAGQGTTSTNTSGSITSTVSVNPTAGFSVVSWTATGSVATVGHGLGVKPSLIITKQRSTTGDWAVLTDIVTGTPQYLYLNTTQAIANTGWGTNPTSSVFSGYSYPNGQTIISYCWAEIAGFSKFGTFTGNGTTDNTFIYTGFRPKFVMIKATSVTSNWFMHDSARDLYNVEQNLLRANLSDAEISPYTLMDFVSNGIKIRDAGFNTDNYIYMAFAENPFKNALAR